MAMTLRKGWRRTVLLYSPVILGATVALAVVATEGAGGCLMTAESRRWLVETEVAALFLGTLVPTVRV